MCGFVLFTISHIFTTLQIFISLYLIALYTNVCTLAHSTNFFFFKSFIIYFAIVGTYHLDIYLLIIHHIYFIPFQGTVIFTFWEIIPDIFPFKSHGKEIQNLNHQEVRHVPLAKLYGINYEANEYE